MNISLAIAIPLFPALAAVIGGICNTRPTLRSLAAPYCIIAIGIGFVITMALAFSDAVLPFNALATAETLTQNHVRDAFTWIQVGDFKASMGIFVDPLTIVMLSVITGVGTLVAIYAVGYMRGDAGFARFFMAVSLFIFAMTTLVLADNLVLLYLGWEGVGLCSYLLIGYNYDKPSAVAAAKKAFIVNRIGDLGFAMGIFVTFMVFDTVSYAELFPKIQEMAASGSIPFAVQLIPFLLMLGAFGKSAQLPLYVWLPDAMEGPTPVSALIHAATMVTAGVYMIARLLPLFVMSPYALPVVATVGALTAIFAATIALCQNDLKKVFAYSTISQLGYMFLGVGVLSSFGAVFHLFTHAFFKALLFLTAGSVMHALAGQLDMRTMSGLRKKMPVTCWLMFVGCLALAGLPPLAGFWSKDTVLAEAVIVGMEQHWWFMVLAVLGIITALLTAFYTFRLWFRVFMGDEQFEMGDEHHGQAPHDTEHGHAVHEPHEMPWWPMNAPLVLLAVGSIVAGIAGYGWMKDSITHSTAGPASVAAVIDAMGRSSDTHHAVIEMAPAATFDVLLTATGSAEAHSEEAGVHHGAASSHSTKILGLDAHLFMQILSGIIAVVGISAAGYFFWFHRDQAERLAAKLGPIPRILENKYYVDEFFHAVIVLPLYFLGQMFYVIDRFIIDGVVQLVAFIPRLAGNALRPAQHGRLQGYGLGMVFGMAAILLLVMLYMMQ